MSPSPPDAELRRAAKAARRVLGRSLPPAFVRWIDRLAEGHESPDEVLACAGALAALALELDRTFNQAGSEVRDLILRLHDFLGAPSDASAPGPAVLPPLPFPEFEAFAPWLRRRLSLPPSAPPAGLAPRLVFLQWIDVASERLTLRRYHRPDLPSHHASTLIARPVLMLGVADPEPTAAGASPHHGPIEEIALIVLRFVDLLDAERLGAQGKNRAAGYAPADMGGFYGVSENVQPPTREILDALHRDLRAASLTLAEKPGAHVTFQKILRDIAAAVSRRIESGEWPSDYRWKSPEARQSPPLWRRLLGG